MSNEHKKKKTASGGKRSFPGEEINDSQFHEEPMRQKCFTRDFATMIQLFRILTEYLEFSKPFKLVIHYDPDSPRVTIETYAPMEVHQRHIQQAEEQCILPSKKENQGEVIRIDPSEMRELKERVESITKKYAELVDKVLDAELQKDEALSLSHLMQIGSGFSLLNHAAATLERIDRLTEKTADHEGQHSSQSQMSRGM